MPSTRAGDPGAMATMAGLLDDVAGELDVHRAVARAAVAETGASPPDLAEIQLVAAWVRDAAADLRRRALQLLSADRPWRHAGLLEHVARVAKAEWSGVFDGVESIGAGLVAAARLTGETVIEPVRVANASIDGGLGAATGEALEFGKRSLGVDVAVGRNLIAQNPEAWVTKRVNELRQDGFWAAAEDAAHDVGVQAPGAVLTLASAGAGAVAEESAALRIVAGAADVASNLSNASYLAPPAVPTAGSGSHGAALALSVDAGDGRRVGFDPDDGQFVVFQPGHDGITAHKTRWSGMGEKDRKTMQDAGVVDRHGHLRAAGPASG